MLTDRFSGGRLYPDHLWRDVVLLERQIAQIEARQEREHDPLTVDALASLRQLRQARLDQIKVSVLEK